MNDREHGRVKPVGDARKEILKGQKSVRKAAISDGEIMQVFYPFFADHLYFVKGLLRAQDGR